MSAERPWPSTRAGRNRGEGSKETGQVHGAPSTVRTRTPKHDGIPPVTGEQMGLDSQANGRRSDSDRGHLFHRHRHARSVHPSIRPRYTVCRIRSLFCLTVVTPLWNKIITCTNRYSYLFFFKQISVTFGTGSAQKMLQMQKIVWKRGKLWYQHIDSRGWIQTFTASSSIWRNSQKFNTNVSLGNMSWTCLSIA